MNLISEDKESLLESIDMKLNINAMIIKSITQDINLQEVFKHKLEEYQKGRESLKELKSILESRGYYDKRISYFKSYEGQKPSLNPPFSSVYVCKDMLPKQIVFEEVHK